MLINNKKRTQQNQISKVTYKKMNLKKTNTQNLHAMNDREHDIQVYDIGDMNINCTQCSALHFSNEGGRVSNSCCHKGKVMLHPLYEYPPEMKELISGTTTIGKEFRKNIRSYNSAFAFATFNANVQNFSSNGPYMLKIQGQVYHTTSSSLRSTNDPRNGQIYIYDVKDAIDFRLKTDNTHRSIVEIIEKVMQKNNSYSKQYKTLNETYLQCKEAKDYHLKFIT